MDTNKYNVKELTQLFENMQRAEYNSLRNQLLEDQRKSVQNLVKKIDRKFEKIDKEQIRLDNLYAIHRQLQENDGYKYIAGIDEAGRGPLAGPVVTACVVLENKPDILYVNDSKKLSEEKRKAIFNEIIEKNLTYAIGMVENQEIDDINILNATFKAMKMAVESIKSPIDIVLVDGNAAIKDLTIPQMTVVDGDAKVFAISLASIIAKVTRDEIMKKYHEIYPQYGFDKNKGYGTQEHVDAIRKYGVTPIHRMSFLKNFNL